MRGISQLEKANEFLLEYVKEFIAKFSVTASQKVTAFVRVIDFTALRKNAPPGRYKADRPCFCTTSRKALSGIDVQHHARHRPPRPPHAVRAPFLPPRHQSRFRVARTSLKIEWLRPKGSSFQVIE